MCILGLVLSKIGLCESVYYEVRRFSWITGKVIKWLGYRWYIRKGYFGEGIDLCFREESVGCWEVYFECVI